MAFITDKQTREELNLIGRYKSDSCFGLFNRTHTKGGERLLEQLLKSPLTDKDDINERTNVFRYFQAKKYTFPLDGETVTAFNEWVDSGSESMLSVWKQKALSSLVKDERYERQRNGLRAAAKVLQELYAFIESNLNDKGTAMPAALKESMVSVKNILSDRKIETLRLLAQKTDVNVRDTAYYGKLIKSTMREETATLLRFIDELDVYIAVQLVDETQ